MNQKIADLLGNEADDLLNHKCKTVPKEDLHLPGPDFVDRIILPSDRSPNVMRNMQLLFNTGRLAGTGYMSILPVDNVGKRNVRDLTQVPEGVSPIALLDGLDEADVTKERLAVETEGVVAIDSATRPARGFVSSRAVASLPNEPGESQTSRQFGEISPLLDVLHKRVHF